jgi:hypothetical protein
LDQLLSPDQTKEFSAKDRANKPGGNKSCNE